MCKHHPLLILSGTQDADLPLASRILEEMLGKFPNGVLFHLYAGRLDQYRGNFDSVSKKLLCISYIIRGWL